MKLKEKQISYKSCVKAISDIDETKGIVKFYASIFGNKDRVGDVVKKGAYTKTITENYSEIQHYKNHNPSLVPGVITELYEDDKGLVTVSKLMLKTPVGNEVYEYYKAMAEAGKKAVHSIGYIPVQEKKENDYNSLNEIYLQEVSTLTKLAANPEALTIDIKSIENFTYEELISEKIFFDCLINAKFEDVQLDLIEKSLHNLQTVLESRRKALLKEPQISTQNLILKLSIY